LSNPLSRRSFIEATAISAGMAALSPALEGRPEEPPAGGGGETFTPPICISTWSHGVAASRAALGVLRAGGSPLEAVERGINTVELDPRVDSVGVGGLPNEDGEVELDAAVMEGSLRCGAVMGLTGIATPISVARRVMERTRHVQLCGKGALQFALRQGFKTSNLLTVQSKESWERWRASPERAVPGQVEKPPARAAAGPGKEPHDTVATLVLDGAKAMAAGCSTSGLAWKLPGRVGDSPIIGAGLYCDGEVGAAGATGIGEEILRVCGSFLIVEGMRRGLTPQAAIQEALRRVARSDPRNRKRQVAFIALSRSGQIGAGAMTAGFQAAVSLGDGRELLLDVPAYDGR
jgi:N4-(beta-N-acetylglucosaminyl)-L-asparaginase